MATGGFFMTCSGKQRIYIVFLNVTHWHEPKLKNR